MCHAESPLSDATAGSETGVEASLFADLAEDGDIARNRKRQRREMLAVGEQFLVTWRGLDQRLEQASDGVGETYDLPDWCTMELRRESNCLVCTTEAGTSFSLQLCAATHVKRSEDKPGSLLLTTHLGPSRATQHLHIRFGNVRTRDDWYLALQEELDWLMKAHHAPNSEALGQQSHR